MKLYGIRITYTLEGFGDRQKSVLRQLYKSYEEAEFALPHAIEVFQTAFSNQQKLLTLDEICKAQVIDFDAPC